MLLERSVQELLEVAKWHELIGISWGSEGSDRANDELFVCVDLDKLLLTSRLVTRVAEDGTGPIKIAPVEA